MPVLFALGGMIVIAGLSLGLLLMRFRESRNAPGDT
jgi:hypothetical protein